jgi:hypothetical protein
MVAAARSLLGQIRSRVYSLRGSTRTSARRLLLRSPAVASLLPRSGRPAGGGDERGWWCARSLIAWAGGSVSRRSVPRPVRCAPAARQRRVGVAARVGIRRPGRAGPTPPAKLAFASRRDAAAALACFIVRLLWLDCGVANGR